jgi:hypothetical protein
MDTHRKDWSEIKSNDSWSIFKIMAEFVEAYDKMAKAGPCVAIFGSARTKSNHPHYIQAVELAERLASTGYGVITGGGPGIMEAGIKVPSRAEVFLLGSTSIYLLNNFTINISTAITF